MSGRDPILLNCIGLGVRIGDPLLVPLLLLEPFDRGGEQLDRRDPELYPVHGAAAGIAAATGTAAGAAPDTSGRRAMIFCWIFSVPPIQSTSHAGP